MTFRIAQQGRRSIRWSVCVCGGGVYKVQKEVGTGHLM